MKILIDENLPIKIKYKLFGHNVFTVREMNWNSAKNGELLKLAIENGYEVLITTDKNLQYQQNISKIGIVLVVLDVLLLKWILIEPLIPKISEVLLTVEKGNTYVIKP